MWIPYGRPGAVAHVAGGSEAPNLFGTVKFYEMGDNVLVVADVYGLPQTPTGIFGFHIHAGENCSGDAFANTGSHYDPEGKEHPNHAGDLPPLFSCRGKAFQAVLTCRFQIAQVLGKTVVIHDKPDDFVSQPAGNSGAKIACGVVGLG